MEPMLSKVMKHAFRTRWLDLYAELQELRIESGTLARKEKELTDQLRSVAESYSQMTGEPLRLTSEQQVELLDSPSLADIVEAMLKERGPLDKAALQDELERSGRITVKNARVVLANALRLDPKKRFTVEAGTVYLAKK